MSAIPLARSADAPPPAPLPLVVTFWVGYLLVLGFGCWLAGVDVGIAHVWHWIGGLLP